MNVEKIVVMDSVTAEDLRKMADDAMIVMFAPDFKTVVSTRNLVSYVRKAYPLEKGSYATTAIPLSKGKYGLKIYIENT